jgi:hypothetical protein
VTPVPGAGGIRGLLSSFVRRSFLVRNPLDRQARIEMKAEIPPFLVERGWSVLLDRRESNTTFGLPPGGSREVDVSLRPGEDFTREELMRVEGGVAIRILVHGDGILMGGMTYALDPSLERAPIERAGDGQVALNDPAIEAAIRGARQSQEEAGLTLASFDEGAAEPKPAAETADAPSATAQELLSQLGLPDQAIGRISRVRLGRLTLNIDFEET